jgi:hypothetical protein
MKNSNYLIIVYCVFLIIGFLKVSNIVYWVKTKKVDSKKVDSVIILPIVWNLLFLLPAIIIPFFKSPRTIVLAYLIAYLIFNVVTSLFSSISFETGETIDYGDYFADVMKFELNFYFYLFIIILILIFG